ncbi:MAG TPA: UDP-N-acetylmuramoyl-L-alanine--D-glutamate ligase [Thermomicrobiales bacterium]|jgi:UDP-N-acetylmuramoylalanine--D-glutamate ligase|nr:UDP-N-acetylmuramoyl-L-alanine--D-glutamate ligase [Thermomicrobiales bacterium]
MTLSTPYVNRATPLPLAGKRVTVMGIGTRGGGLGVIQWLVGQGADVTATDRRTAEDLGATMTELAGLPVRLALGGHDERDFSAAGADVVVRNPAIPRRAPLLELARREGVPVEMEMSLFIRACPAPVVGVTGTKGKTTTSTLIAHVLRNEYADTILAGNMGISALMQLDRMRPDTPVVVELSSWQIESLIEHQLSPHVAVLTNISEDHLNTYDGFDDYADTKRGLFRAQVTNDVAVLNRDDPEVWRAAGQSAGRVVSFGLDSPADGIGAWREGDELVVRDERGEVRIPRPAGLALAGDHGVRNALAAMAVARTFDARDRAIAAGIEHFPGVPHRMERVGEVGGVEYINDTTATAPAAAIAALSAMGGRRVHWIGGGFDKGLGIDELARVAATRPVSIHLLDGSATPQLSGAIVAAGGRVRGPYGSMLEAALTAHRDTMPGDVVLLSPGCASFGLFRDEFDRGEQFRAAVARIDAICSGAEPDPFL